MTTRLLLLVLLASTTWAATTPSNRPTRGYQGRASGFDHNGDGSFDATLCDDRTGSTVNTTEDVDSNGVADRQIYVDCDSGTDDSDCGGADTGANACRTLEYADTNRTVAPSATQIQALCFRGTCGNATLSLSRSGASGTWTRAQTGSEDRAFEYPRYPFIISGWDYDQDDSYPPYDGDDAATVDGNVSGDTSTFFNAVDSSRYEVAHFTIRDYGRGCGAGATLGVGSPGGNGNLTHAYWHDLIITDVMRGCNIGNPASESGYILFGNWIGGATYFRYFALENANIQNAGGYISRGSCPGVASPSFECGPYRWKNLTYTHYASAGATVVLFKPWGWIQGYEVLDSTFDIQPGTWGGTDASNVNGLEPAQCAQGVTARNTLWTDFKSPLHLQVSSSASDCNNRDLDEIVFDANEVTTTYNYGWIGWIMLWAPPSDYTGGNQTLQNWTITNNVIRVTDADVRAVIADYTSRTSGAVTGTLTINNNTIALSNASCDGGAVAICTGIYSCDNAEERQNMSFQNNILLGCSSGSNMLNIRSGAASNLVADNNLYESDANANWVWNGSSQSTLAAWRTALGGCPNSGNDCSAKNNCSPTYVSSTDLHLGSGESTCVKDLGMDAGVDADYDGQAATGARDIGADEYQACHGGR